MLIYYYFIYFYTSLIDENGNIPKRKPVTMMKTSTSLVAIPDAVEPLLLNEDSSGCDKMPPGKLLPTDDAKESSGTSYIDLKQEITVASSSQGIGPFELNNSLETESCKEVSEPVLKCKYA